MENWLPVAGSFVAGILGVLLTNTFQNGREKKARTQVAAHAIREYIIALDRYSDYLWAIGTGSPAQEGFPAYRPDKDLLNPGSRAEIASAKRVADPYLHLLKFPDDASRRKALSTTIPDSGQGHPIPDAEVCDEQVKLLTTALETSLKAKAL